MNTGAGLQPGTPVELFGTLYSSPSGTTEYDVAEDGRFLMVKGSAPLGPARQINVIRNWSDELKERVPVP